MSAKTPEQARRWAARHVAEPDRDNGAARVFRALLTRERWEVEALSLHAQVSPSIVYLVLGDMRRAGYPVEKVEPSVWQLTGDQGDEPLPVERTGRGASSSTSPTSTTGALVPVHRANGSSRKELERLLRPAPAGLPDLGHVLRVAMLAEHDDGDARLVLTDAHGRSYFARLEPT